MRHAVHHLLVVGAHRLVWKKRGAFKAIVLIQRLSYPTETVLSNKITRNNIS